MDVEILEMRVKVRKVVIFTMKRCFRSVCNHPFLVGMLCFLVFLYRSSPFVFSLLVSASPVLVCTAVLLGTLLSFGQPNIPEIERDENISHEIASFNTGFSGEGVVVEENESYSVENVSHRFGETVEHFYEESNSYTNRTSKHNRSDSLDSSTPLVEEMSREMIFENKVVEEGRRELHVSECEQKNKMHDVRVAHGEIKTDDEDLDLENDKSPAESFDSEMVNVDSLDSPPGSPWKHAEEGEEQEEEEDDEDDSESDGAESSSPDASMADIIPMLDELHPLLDEDAPQPATLSHDGSDAASERSNKSSDSSSESDDNSEKHEEMEGADEDNEDNEDAENEDEAHGAKEDQTKSAITWTEEDQKNLMDLGTSELERNQRLESLIARRRARKTMSMMTERNLIDLESIDLPFNITPISTARNNPFDLPHDSYDNMGMPPIPGSAPSIMLQRRNPFDLPYDSSEEKPDLMEDSFQQEFTASQPKEPFFRRNETFNAGPSFFGPSRQETRFRPFFVPERMDSEGSSYSPFQRQSSGLSDSKASSVPETDSVISAGDAEDKNLMEEKISQLDGPVDSVPEIELRSRAEDLETKNLTDEDISEEPELLLNRDYKNLIEENVSQERELTSKMEDVSEHVGHGSQSSEEDSSELGEVEKRDIESDEVDIGLRDAENHHESEQMVFEEGDIANLVVLNSTEPHSNAESVKEGYISFSSSSSLSEVSERIFAGRETEELPSLEEIRDNILEEAEISRQYSVEGSDLNPSSSLAGNTTQKEPIYDSSPHSVVRNLSSSSISSDLHVESEMGFPPLVIKRTISFGERESESGGQEIGRVASDDKEMVAHSSAPHPSDENQYVSRTEVEISGHHINKFDLPQVDNVSESRSAPALPESSVNLASVNSESSPDTSAERDFVYQQESSEYLENQISASSNIDVHDVHSVLHQTVESMANTFDDQILVQSEEQVHLKFVEQVPNLNTTSTQSQSSVVHPVDKEVEFQHEQDQASASNSGTSYDAGITTEPEEKQISASNQYTSQTKSISEYGEELVFLDKSVDETYAREHQELQEQSVIIEDMVEDLSSKDSLSVSGIQELEQVVSPNINSPTSPESITIPSEAYESRAAEGYSDTENNIIDEFENNGQFDAIEGRKLSETNDSQVNMQNVDDMEDEIKEIDEVLLAELDTVGDFSVKDFGSHVKEFDKHVASTEESSSAPQPGSSSAVDDRSIQLNESQSIMNSENLMLSEVVDVDTHGEEEKSVSEPQTSGTSAMLQTELSSKELIEEVPNSVDVTPTEEKTLPREDEIDLAHSRVVQNLNIDVNSEMPVVEARSKEDIESIFKQAEVTSVGMETLLGISEMPHGGHVIELSTAGFTGHEAQTLVDVGSAFKQISQQETEKPDATDPAHAEQQLTPSEFAVVEARSLEDAGLASKKVSEMNETGTSSDVQSTVKEISVHESRKGAENPDAEDEKSESSIASYIKGKEKDSHKSSSSSSSSSSSDSSSSDSDKE